MSDFNAQILGDDDTVIRVAVSPIFASLPGDGGGTLTYQFRYLATGIIGTTTSAASIPAGTVVIGTYTS